MSTPEVVLDRVTKRFGRFVANDAISLTLVPGEVHALVGENGAGKSTLMKVLFGLHAPESGRILLDGHSVRFGSPEDALARGLGMVHQHFLLVDSLSVAENVVLGREPRRALGAFDRAKAERDVAERALRLGLPVEPQARIADLSVGQQQRVEILKALYRGARILILDEPTAVLTPQEVDELFALLRTLRSQGTSIVLITHKLQEVGALADHVTVLRQGRVVGDGRASEMSRERIAELMVGRVLAPLQARSARAAGDVALEAASLEVLDDRGAQAVAGLSLAVRAGEILGIAGVEGNGQHELLEALTGLRTPTSGRVSVGGRDVTRAPARDVRAAGLANIPSDRLDRGLIADMTLAENLVLGRQHDARVGKGPWLGGAALERSAEGPLESFDVRPPDPRVRASRLSGGNQQKLIAARELGFAAGGSQATCALIAAHPTRGVDLGAIDAIHRRLIEARDAGLAVLLVSSELSELLAVSDRLCVLYEGRIVHETTPGSTDERTLGLHMTGRASLIDSPLPHTQAPEPLA